MIGPSEVYSYVMCSDGSIFHLLDVSVCENTLEETITKIESQHGKIVRTSCSPNGLFSAVYGVRKDGKFEPIGMSNWDKLFWIRGNYEYFLGFISNDKTRGRPAARSTTGVFWQYNVIDA